MKIFELGIAASIGLLNFFCLYIKYILWKRGYKVIWFLEWGKDYQRFKQLVNQEQDGKTKQKYRGILYSLRFSGGLLVFSFVLGVVFTY